MFDNTTPSREQVSFRPKYSEPCIVEKTDGPMLICTDGSIHFLTWSERILFGLGVITLFKLDRKHRTDIVHQKGRCRVWD